MDQIAHTYDTSQLELQLSQSTENKFIWDEIKPKGVHQPLMSSSLLDQARERSKYSSLSKPCIMWMLGTQHHFALQMHFYCAMLLANVDIVIWRVTLFHFSRWKRALAYKPPTFWLFDADKLCPRKEMHATCLQDWMYIFSLELCRSLFALLNSCCTF